MKNDRFVTIRCIFVPVGWDAASPGNEKIRLPNDRTYAGAAAQPLVCLSFPDAFFFCPGTPEPLPVSRHPSASSGTGRTRKAPTLREKCRGIRRSGRSAHLCGSRHGYSGPRIVPSACTPEPLPVSRRPSVPSGSLFRMPPGPAPPIDRKRLLSGPRIGPPACTATLFGPGTRLLCPIRFSGSLPALRPRSTASACPAARESCLPPAPPPSLAPAPPNRFRYPGARLFRPEQDGRERLRPSGKKCRGIRRSGRSAHPCGPRHGYSAPPVADGAFSVHRCFSISTNHSGQRHGRRVSLRMNPSTVDPVLSSSPRSFRIS